MELSRINELLTYDPLTGEITMKDTTRRVLADADGFVTIWDNLSKKKTKFKADRLCWTLGNNKKLRKNQKVLHLNLILKDNRLTNLKLIPSTVFNKVQEAAKNLSGALRIQPHPTDRYDLHVFYFNDKVLKKETYSDIMIAQRRLIELQLRFAKVLTRFCIFDN